MKISLIVGARPQFVKHAPLCKELMKTNLCITVHTGQHYDYSLSRVFFDELGIPAPNYNLGIGSGTHSYQTANMMKSIEDILLKENPSLVIVYGDTNSTLAGALAAAKTHFKLAHVEAGLRMNDKSVPEELNRVLTDHCSDYLFCPTQTAVDNLTREGISEGVYLTGDVMVDALDFNRAIAEKSPILATLGLTHKQYIVATLHRAANTDSPENLESISNALVRLAELGETIVFPVHPRTEKELKKHGRLERLRSKLRLTEPLGYLEFLKLLDHAKKVVTDSGGIQKEAYMLKVPCVTVMDRTTWVETVAEGWNVLAGTDTDRIVELTTNFVPPNQYASTFGAGACERIAGIVGQM